MNFEEFNKIFGIANKLSDEQKNPCGTPVPEKGSSGTERCPTSDGRCCTVG